MIDPKHELSVTRQAELVGISRAAVYYVPRPVSEADLALMRRIDALHLECPFAGARTLKRLLRREGYDVGVKGNPDFPRYGNRKFPTRFTLRPLRSGRGRLSTSLSAGTSYREC